MSYRVSSYSLPESLLWELEELNKKTGVPKSKLVMQALLLLISEYRSRTDNYSFQVGSDFTIEDIEKEYAERGK